MKNENEKTIKERLLRRLKGDRASVFLEFAIIAPLAIILICFAADFTRILRTEQQLEIAARAAADIQIHLSGTSDGQIPDSKAKIPVKYYLQDIAQVVDSVDHVYLKAKVFSNHNLMTAIVNLVNKYIFGESLSGGGWFWDLFTEFIKGTVKLLTMGADSYIRQVIPTDKGLIMTCSCAIKPLLPTFCYSYFGPLGHRADKGYLMVVQAETEKSSGRLDPMDPKTSASSDIDSDLKYDYRNRYWVAMPILDTVPLACDTIIKDIRNWKIIKVFVGK